MSLLLVGFCFQHGPFLGALFLDEEKQCPPDRQDSQGGGWRERGHFTGSPLSPPKSLMSRLLNKQGQKR